MTDSGALETDGSSDKFSVNQLVETTPSGTRYSLGAECGGALTNVEVIEVSK